MRKQTKLAVMLASVALLVVSAASIVSARGWVQQGGNWYYEKSDGEFATDEIQTSGTSKFYLGEDGTMQTDYFLEDFGDGNNTYYFGSNGAMVTNTWVAIDPSIVSNQGDVVPAVYWYYFGSTGKATKASAGTIKKTTVDGKKFGFNEYGQMLTGWIDSVGAVIDPDEDDPFENAVYYAGDENDGQLHSGWLTYLDGTTRDEHEDKNALYFYFNPTNNVKLGRTSDGQADNDTGKNYKTKKINGRTYAFEASTGIMLSGWDAYDNSTGNKVYFSAEDDGHQVKKGWVYAVPDEDMDRDAYNDDEEKYMYFLNNGDMVTNQIKKINGKYYAFDASGIMKTGLLMFNNQGEYKGKIDFDDTNGAKFVKEGQINTADATKAATLTITATGDIEKGGETVRIHLFGSDGARRTGSNNVTFSDDDYTFGSNNNGNFQGVNKKKYYNLGILLKASADIRYGIMVDTPLSAQTWAASTTDFFVLNTSGSKVDGSNSAKKDADGNYWMIAKATTSEVNTPNELVGIYTVEVKYGSLAVVDGAKTNAAWTVTDDAGTGATQYVGFLYKADSYVDRNGLFGTDTTKSYSNKWLPFGVVDDSGRTCSTTKGAGAYQVTPNADYALNFHWN